MRLLNKVQLNSTVKCKLIARYSILKFNDMWYNLQIVYVLAAFFNTYSFLKLHNYIDEFLLCFRLDFFFAL